VKELSSRNLPDSTPYKAHQDEDVLDTWFSSGLLPLSASGWTGPGTTAVSEILFSMAQIHQNLTLSFISFYRNDTH
jgi:valyl-tRNA synthetase